MKTNNLFNLALLLLSLTTACKKNWLDGKPNKALVIPQTVADYQALLDNVSDGNAGMNANQPSMSMVGDGDYQISDATYNALGYPPEKGAYTWAATADFYSGQANYEWISAYTRLLQANIVLDGITALSNTDPAASNNIKGSALFFRSYNFYELAQQYCPPYNAATAGTDPGLPLRLSADINVVIRRSTLQATYDRMIGDLQQALPLLPVTPLYPTRPSKPAAYGLLARIYLSQENYSQALLYADSCLQLQPALMDFNELSLTAATPIAYFNKEVIFHSQLTGYQSGNPPALIVDPGLGASYSAGDLRPGVFFINQSGVLTMHSSYVGSNFGRFGGLATDEMYLDRAECYARAGNTAAALQDLNKLLKNRYRTGTFSGLTAANADAALALIVAERRKELCFRNLRWPDLRRLNKDPRFQVTLTRTVSGKVYTLPPNSPRYVLPLDPIETTSGGLEQNPR